MENNNKNNYLSFFTRSLVETLSEMSEQDCQVSGPREQPGTITSRGVAVIIGITGARRGRIILDCSRETAWKLSQLINGEEYDINDNFILYTMSELTNILSGRAITMVNNANKGLGLRLTPPGIFFGDRLYITSPRIDAEMIGVSTPAGSLQVSVGFEGGA